MAGLLEIGNVQPVDTLKLLPCPFFCVTRKPLRSSALSTVATDLLIS
jgi:hypothetical protein